MTLNTKKKEDFGARFSNWHLRARARPAGGRRRAVALPAAQYDASPFDVDGLTLLCVRVCTHPASVGLLFALGAVPSRSCSLCRSTSGFSAPAES